MPNVSSDIDQFLLAANKAAARGVLDVATDFIQIDAAEFIPRTTLGVGVDSQETTINRINEDLLLFDPVTTEFAQKWFVWPDGWNTATATFCWKAATGTGSVAWSARLLIFSDGDPIDSAFGTAVDVVDAAASANTVRYSAATAPITPAGVVGAFKWALLGISRNKSNGSDNMPLDAMLKGVLLQKAS